MKVWNYKKISEELTQKQYELEEQNTIIEELNAQLEDENDRYQQQKEILQAMTDSLGGGVIMLDTTGKIVFINKTWREIFNYIDLQHNCDSCDGFYINSFTCGDTKTFLQNMMTGIENGQEVVNELMGLVGDGGSRYVVDLEQTSPIKRFLNLYSNPCISHNNNIYGRVIVVRDVSHQKEVDRLKVELISTVSHELRTPMSSILGFSELLLTRKLPEERSKEYLSIINSEAKRLTELINVFLDIQRMESGQQVFNKQVNSMSKMVEESIKVFENTSDKHNIIYDKSKNIYKVYCDRDKILRVLSNLISNAIKYSPDGGEISIESIVVDGRIKVSITDHGLGIPDNAKDKLFTKFFRVDNDDRRKIGGSGLGLAICKEIIHAHGGEVGVASKYGHGSTFYFYLPYRLKNISDESKKKCCENSLSENVGEILVVEDDVSMVKLIKEILKDEGFKMHGVSSGEEALEYLGKYHYKLIILDIALGGKLNGWDVIKELKNNKVTANVPIIVSSIYENQYIASQKSVTNYLVKPFGPDQLISMVKKAFNESSSSGIMLDSSQDITEIIIEIFVSKGIDIKRIEHAGNIMIITLEEEEDLKDE